MYEAIEMEEEVKEVVNSFVRTRLTPYEFANKIEKNGSYRFVPCMMFFFLM